MSTAILQSNNLDFQSSGSSIAKLTASSNLLTATGSGGGDCAITGLSNVTASGTATAATFTDGTLSINAGAVTGAVSIATGSMTATGAVTGGSVTDGTATLSSGSMTGLVNTTASGTATAGTFTDGTLSVNAGAVTGAVSIATGSVTATGAVTGGSVTDGTATLTSGSMTGLVNTTASGTATAGTFTDGTATLTSGSMTGLVNTTASGTATAGTFTDGTLSVNAGAVTGAVSIATGSVTATGAVTGGSLTDGTATLSSGTLSGLVAPTGASDATNKQYVDAIANGLHWREAVIAATTAAVTLSTDLENGDTLDGVVLATNDRILVKDQASALENGVYVVQASGAPVRAADMAVGVDVASYAVFVEQGSTNADQGFTCTNDTGSATVDTDALVFTQFTGLGQIIAGDGLSKTGNQLDVDATVVRTAGNQSIAGVKTFSDTTNATSSTSAGAVFSGGVGVAQDVYSAGEMYAVAFNATSDENFKQDIRDIDESDLDRLMNVRAVSYRFKGISDESRTRYGIIAQDLEANGLGHMVHTDEAGTKKVNYNDLIGLLIAEVQLLKKQLFN